MVVRGRYYKVRVLGLYNPVVLVYSQIGVMATVI